MMSDVWSMAGADIHKVASDETIAKVMQFLSRKKCTKQVSKVGNMCTLM